MVANENPASFPVESDEVFGAFIVFGLETCEGKIDREALIWFCGSACGIGTSGFFSLFCTDACWAGVKDGS